MRVNCPEGLERGGPDFAARSDGVCTFLMSSSPISPLIYSSFIRGVIRQRVGFCILRGCVVLRTRFHSAVERQRRRSLKKGGAAAHCCEAQMPEMQSSPFKHSSPSPRRVSVQDTTIAIGRVKQAKMAIA